MPEQKKRASRRRRQSAPERPVIPEGTCQITGCGKPAVVDGWCWGHWAAGYLSGNARRAKRRGDDLISAGWQKLAEMAPDVISGLGQRDLKQDAYTAYTAGAAWRAQQQAQAKATTKHDPFVVLRLDRSTATVEDVRRVQRKLAEIYHEDKAAGGVDSAAMAEINQAVDEAIKAIRKR